MPQVGPCAEQKEGVGGVGGVSFTQVPGASHVGSEHWQVSPEAHLL